MNIKDFHCYMNKVLFVCVGKEMLITITSCTLRSENGRRIKQLMQFRSKINFDHGAV